MLGKGSSYRESERELAKCAEWGDDGGDFMGSMAKVLVASCATHPCPETHSPLADVNVGQIIFS